MRIGFYVSNELEGFTTIPTPMEGTKEGETAEEASEREAQREKEREAARKAALAGPIDYNKIIRNILSAKPRVTRFNIEWDPVTLP